MGINTKMSGAVDAVVSAPSTGEALRFAAYVAELIGDHRVDSIAWHGQSTTGPNKLFVTVTDTTHGETVAHLLGLAPRSDVGHVDHEGFSCWEGTSGNVPVFLSAPMALGGMPRRRPWDWSHETTAAIRAVA